MFAPVVHVPPQLLKDDAPAALPEIPLLPAGQSAPTSTSSQSPNSQPNSSILSAKPLIHYPLSSFVSTPHNVSCIAFVLGCVFMYGFTQFLPSLSPWSERWLLWTPYQINHAKQILSAQGLRNAIKSPTLGAYTAGWALFHLLEFVVTSMWNPGKLSVSSYLLDNGTSYHYAHAFGILEHVLEEAYFPSSWRAYKHVAPIVLFGAGLMLGGQIFRSFAMITAGKNFSHIIAHKKLETHELVTSGIYSYSRHPSYAGFCWWALGTQIMLGNPISFLGFSLVLYSFFAGRIAVEEQLLIKFFGDDYIKYRQRVPTRILFIR